jgi:predicted ATPase
MTDQRARFTRVSISNYRSIGPDVSIELGDFTALVGTNGSGKSNVADTFRFVSNALNDGLESAIEDRHGFDAVRRVVDGSRGVVKLRFELSHPEWSGEYEFALKATRGTEYRVSREMAMIRSADGATVTRFETLDGEVKQAPDGLDRPARDRINLTFPKIGGDDRLKPLFDALRANEVYAVFPDTLRTPQPPSQRRYLTKKGENWSSAVRRVITSPQGVQLRTALSRVTGDVNDVRVRRAGGGYLIVEFAHRAFGDKVRWFDAAMESDGTLRVAGIITALLQDPSLTLTGVEEPELTVHAGMVPLLYDYLMEATLSSQILVTTHSPDLLDRIPIEAVRVVQRIGGVTTVSPVEEHQRRLVKDNLMTVGELLRTEGLLGAEPAGQSL